MRTLLLILCLLTLTGCGSSHHADTSGTYLASIKTARWSKSVVKYRIKSNSSEIRRAVRTAIHNWDDTFAGILSLQQTEGDEVADITFEFVPVGSLGGDFLGSQTLGRERQSRSVPVVSGGYFESVTIKLDQQLILRPFTLSRISAHEVGHALFALQFHSPHHEDLMASPPNRSTPNARDTRTARAVYGF